MKLCGAVAIAIVINFIIDCVLRCVLRIKSNIEQRLEQLYFKNSETKEIEKRLNEIENNIMIEMACLAAKIDNDIKNIKYEPSVGTVDKAKEYSVDQLIEENKRLKEEYKILKQKYSDVCEKYLKILKIVYPHRYGLDINSLKW